MQRLTMIRGRDVGTGFRPRDGEKTCAWGYKDGGGALSTRDVNLRVWGVTFEDNHGPELGPDVAGGAIYMAGSKSLTVANSTFRGNSAGNGGAIGVLHVESRIYNTRDGAGISAARARAVPGRRERRQLGSGSRSNCSASYWTTWIGVRPLVGHLSRAQP